MLLLWRQDLRPSRKRWQEQPEDAWLEGARSPHGASSGIRHPGPEAEKEEGRKAAFAFPPSCYATLSGHTAQSGILAVPSAMSSGIESSLFMRSEIVTKV